MSAETEIMLQGVLTCLFLALMLFFVMASLVGLETAVQILTDFRP